MFVKEVELTIPGDLKDKPIFYTIIKNFSVIPNIIEASFSTDMGWAIVSIEGEEEEINKLFEFLRGKGVRVILR